jgi:hypothetical protein
LELIPGLHKRLKTRAQDLARRSLSIYVQYRDGSKKTLHDASPVVRLNIGFFEFFHPFFANFGSGKIRIKNGCTVMAENPQTRNAERIVELLHLTGGDTWRILVF